MRRKLRLYVWKDFARDYTAGIAVALAHDSEEARQLVIEEMGYTSSDLARSPEVHELNVPVAFCVAGGG